MILNYEFMIKDTLNFSMNSRSDTIDNVYIKKKKKRKQTNISI